MASLRRATQNFLRRRIEANEAFSDDEAARLVADVYGENLGSYFNQKVRRDAALKYITECGRAFRAGETVVPLPLHMDQALDLGVDYPNDACYCTPVDMTQADDLQRLLSQKLRYDATVENTYATLISYRTLDARLSRKFQGICYRRKEFLIVSRRPDDSRVFLDLLDERGLQALFSAPATRNPDLTQDLSRYIPHRSRRTSSIVDVIRVFTDGRWRRIPIRETGSMIVTDEGVPDRVYRGNVASFAEAETAEGDEDEDDEPPIGPGTGGGVPVGGGTAPTGDGAGGGGGSGTVGGGGGGMGGPAGSGIDESGRFMYGPPNGRGAAGCGAETTGDCNNCCIAYQMGGFGTAVGAGLQCNTVCGPLLPCFALCALAMAAAATGILWYFERCKDNCRVLYWEQY